MKVIEVITIKSINQLIETLKKLENDNVSEYFIKKVYRDLQERQTQPTKVSEPTEIAPSCGKFITTDTPLEPLISSFIKSENDKDFLGNKVGDLNTKPKERDDLVVGCITFIKTQIEKFKEKDLADLADLTDASINNLSLEELKTKLENLKTKLENLKNTYNGAPPNIIRDITSEYANKIKKIEAKIKEKNVEIENKTNHLCASNPDRVGCKIDTLPGKKNTSLFTKTLKRLTR